MKFWVPAAALLISAGAAAEPLIFDNGRLFIEARINDVPTEALLDSGAEATLLDDQFAQAAKLPAGRAIRVRGSGGEADAQIVQGATIEALGLSLQPEAVVVMDLDEISERLIKRPTRAVVGRELFDAARLRIDIRAGTIDRVDIDVVPPGRRLELVPHAGIESIPVVLNGHSAQAEFDLGNGSEVMVSRTFAEKLGIRTTGRKAGGGIGREIMRDTVVLDRLEVAGATFRNVPAVIDDQPNANDLNVGTSVLQHFRMTTDFKNRSVWLEPVEQAR